MKRTYAILAAAAALMISCGKEPQPSGPGPVTPPADTTVTPPADTTVTPPVVSGTADLRLMYFNIRTSWSSEDVGIGCDWPRRKAGCWAMLGEYTPDVVGFNEMKPDQLSDMKNEMKAYTCFEGAVDDSDGNYIFYRADVVEPVAGACGKFWLSPTPDEQSYPWTGDDPRYRTCIYTRFRHIGSGNEFWFFLVHPSSGASYDVMKECELIKNRMNATVTDDTPVFIGGDMNCRENGPGMIFLKSYMAMVRDIAPVTDRKGTYNDWGVRANMIDHILMKGKVSVSKFETVDKKYECEAPFISDHYPVYAEVTVGTDKAVEVPAQQILLPGETNVPASGGVMSGSFSTMPSAMMDTPSSYKEGTAMKLGTTSNSGSFTFLPPSTGDVTLSFSAFSWNKAQAVLEISVTGGGTIDGKTSVKILPRGGISGSYVCIGVLPEDLYRFELKGVTESTMVSMKTGMATESEIKEQGATPKCSVAILGLNVSGGTPRSGSSTLPAPLNPRDDYSGIFLQSLN